MRATTKDLESDLMTIYENVISTDLTSAHFIGFLQALMNFPLNKGLLPSGCEEIQKQMRCGYIEGRKLMKSYFNYGLRDIKFSFSKN